MKKLFVCIILIFTFIFTMAPSVSAANVCTDNVSGNAESSTTFTVSTQGKWYRSTTIKLTQNGKGTAKGTTWSGKSKTYNTYGCYKVTYVNSNGKKKTVDFTGKNLTLRLEKNQKYTITITPYSQQKMHSRNLSKLGFYGWKNAPSWKVKSTGGNIVVCG